MDAQKRGEKVDPPELDRKHEARSKRRCRSTWRRWPSRCAATRSTQQSDLENQRLDARDMQRLAEQMRDAARQDRMDDAREKMAELDKMLDECRTGALSTAR